MSNVTNAILVMSLVDEEEGSLERANAFFGNRQRGFISVTGTELPPGWYGGEKSLECCLAIGAFNFLNVDELKAHLRTVNWWEPQSVQLLTMDQEEDLFASWTLDSELSG